MKTILNILLISLMFFSQKIIAACSYINCLQPTSKICACGIECLGQAYYQGYYQWCAGGSGAYGYCTNTAQKVGWTASCDSVYNWAAIAACAGNITSAVPGCIDCIASKGRNTKACVSCLGNLAAIPAACTFCNLVTCSPGTRVPDIRQVLSEWLVGGGECNGGPSICDP